MISALKLCVLLTPFLVATVMELLRNTVLPGKLCACPIRSSVAVPFPNLQDTCDLIHALNGLFKDTIQIESSCV